MGRIGTRLTFVNSVADEASARLGPVSASKDLAPRRLMQRPEKYVHYPGKYPMKIKPGQPLGTPASAMGHRSSREYLLYVPQSYDWQEPISLWILAPGTSMSNEGMLTKIGPGLVKIAENHSVAMVVLRGLGTRLAVGKDAEGLGPHRADDIAYTQAVLRVVFQKVSVDNRRIYCVGFSRGARFCSRLASELSSFISAIATISGIRYPLPNNATRPVAVVAFHGTKDPVNPLGGGGAWYWGSSVVDALQRWATFNRCTVEANESINTGVALFRHSECSDDAEVLLYKLHGAGHDWPDLKFIDANDVIWQFFRDHPIRSPCHTAQVGESCYHKVISALREDIASNPAMYPGLTTSSSFEYVQAALHAWVYADCPQPCAPGGQTTHLAAAARSNDATNNASGAEHGIQVSSVAFVVGVLMVSAFGILLLVAAKRPDLLQSLWQLLQSLLQRCKLGTQDFPWTYKILGRLPVDNTGSASTIEIGGMPVSPAIPESGQVSLPSPMSFSHDAAAPGK